MNDQIKFSCLSCGQHIECDVTETGRSMLCPSCGANLTVPHVMSEILPPSVLDNDADKPIQTPAPAPGARRISGFAVASLICSLTCIGLLPGIICGHVARYRIRHDPTLTGKGLATTGLIISYLNILLVVGLAAYIVRSTSTEFNEAFQLAQSFVVTNPPASTPVSQPVRMATNESAQVSSGTEVGTGWTLDVKHATIPGDTVSGEVHGMDFQLGRALFRNGIIRLISSDGQEWVLIHNLGDSIANDNLEFQTASGSDAPKIELGWKEGTDKKTEMFQDGYAMELNLGNAKGRRISGQIYLCVPDDSKSYIAGTFTVVLPKPKPKPQPAL
jgi:uncharacterized protein DUF4190